MNTRTTLSKGSWIQLNERRAARTAMLLLLLLLMLPATVQAQFNYTINNGTVTITGYTGPGGAVVIPSTIASLPVTSIGGQAFYNCTNLTSVTIPDSVTNLGSSVLAYCTHLTNVTIPDGVTNIGDHAFYNCINLPNVTIPDSVTSIGDGAFAWCTSLTSVTIPNSVTSIGISALNGCASLTTVTIGNSVTNIGVFAFFGCTSLTSVTIPDSVNSIAGAAFAGCTSLPSITIPNSATTIGLRSFNGCTGLSSVTIGNGVTNIGDHAFDSCRGLTVVYFQGNAPTLGGSSVFTGDNNAIVYYLPGTTGWGSTYGGRPTALWLPPTITASPLTQTAEAGSAVGLRVEASGSSPLFCWYFNSTNLISSSTSCEFELTNVQFAQSGAYTVVVTNGLGAATSSPALLNVIAAVEHRPVPGVQVTGQTASLWNVDYADSLNPAPNWTMLGSVSLTGTAQYWFDLTLPLPPQRFYRAWQTGTPGVRPSLDLHLVPAITLTGNIGHSVRLDYINQFGPTDAWGTVDMVTLTNTSQLYFDVSAPGQPPRLYRLVPSP